MGVYCDEVWLKGIIVTGVYGNKIEPLKWLNKLHIILLMCQLNTDEKKQEIHNKQN